METRSVFASSWGELNSRSSPLRFSVSCVRFILGTVSILSLGCCSNAHRVIGGNETVVQGGTVILPCKLIGTTEELTQVSWQRKTREKLQTDNFLTILPNNTVKFVNGNDMRFKFIGDCREWNGSLQLLDVRLLDEGVYTCIFTLFPSGHVKTDIPLNLLVPPVSSVMDNLPVLGDEEVSLATCTAAGSRPPAEVKWLLGPLAGKVKEINNSISNANGTTTTVSSLFGVPTKEISHHVVKCVVTSPALSEPETIPFTIKVNFAPTEVNIIVRSEDTFECVTEAIPNATFTWTRASQSGPQSADIDGAALRFLSTGSDLNVLYQCEASNPYGRNHVFLYVHTNSGSCSACWTFFTLIVIAVVATAAAWYLYKNGKWPRREEGTRRVDQREDDEGQQLESQQMEVP